MLMGMYIERCAYTAVLTTSRLANAVTNLANERGSLDILRQKFDLVSVFFMHSLSVLPCAQSTQLRGI